MYMLSQGRLSLRSIVDTDECVEGKLKAKIHTTAVAGTWQMKGSLALHRKVNHPDPALELLYEMMAQVLSFGNILASSKSFAQSLKPP